MTPTTILIAALGSTALFVALWTALAPRKTASLARLGTTAGQAADGALPVRADRGQALRDQFQAAVGQRVERSTRGARIAERLADADLRLRPTEWLATIGIGSAAVGALLVLRFQLPAMLPVGLGLGVAGSEAVLRIRTGRRRKAFDNQLAPTILSLSSGLKAGYTFGQAVDMVSRNSAAPMGPELARITREVRLGVPLVEALNRMVQRVRSDDLKLMVTAVQIQAQVGGNLAQILDTIEYTIRERVRIKGEIKTITSQARISGYILIALPFALGGFLSLLAPTYFLPMLHQVLGLIMLGTGGLFLAIGYAIIRKIVNIRV